MALMVVRLMAAVVQETVEPAAAHGVTSAYVTPVSVVAGGERALPKGTPVLRTRHCPLDREAQNAILGVMDRIKPVDDHGQGYSAPLRSRYLVTFRRSDGKSLMMAFTPGRGPGLASPLWFDGIAFDPDWAEARIILAAIERSGCDISISAEGAE